MSLYLMKDLLIDAKTHHYGVGYFNAINLQMTMAYIRAAEKLRSPIIIGTAQELLRYGGLDVLSPVLLDCARRASVPVAVHLDHAYDFDVMMQALRYGFGSVMYDGSRESYEKNVEVSSIIAKIAHPMGAHLECELGCVGGLQTADGDVDDNIYTDPAQAAEFAQKTACDFLAVSIGTVHGVYKSTPTLDLNRLSDIQKAVDIPLVLHGGSGLADNDFKATIQGGIVKVNIYTDIILAAKQALKEASNMNYTDMMLMTQDAMTAATVKKLALFNSANRA